MKINFRTTAEQKEFLSKLENQSEFIRQAIDYYRYHHQLLEEKPLEMKLEEGLRGLHEKVDKLAEQLKLLSDTPRSKQVEAIDDTENKEFNAYLASGLEDFL